MIYLVESNTYTIFQNVVIAFVGGQKFNFRIIPFITNDISNEIKTILEHKNTLHQTISVKEILDHINVTLESDEVILKDYKFRNGDWKNFYKFIKTNYGMSLRDFIYVKNLDEIPLEVWIYSILSSKPILVNEKEDIQSLMIFLASNITMNEVSKIQNEITNKYGNNFSRGYFYCPYEENKLFLVIKYITYLSLNYKIEKDFAIYDSFEDLDKNMLVDTKEKYGYVHLLGHSNGIDMGCGNTVICGKNQKHYPIEGHFPPCVYGDVCNRKGIKIFPEDISADIVFLYTCWGILFDQAMYDKRISLSSAFILSINSGIYISTYSKSNLDKDAGKVIGSYLSQGMSVGKAVQLFNLQHYLKYFDTPEVLMIMGDPDFTIKLKSISMPDKELEPYIANAYDEISHNITLLYLLDFIAKLCSEKSSICEKAFRNISNCIQLLVKYIILSDSCIDKHDMKERLSKEHRKEYLFLVRKYQQYWIEAYLSLVCCIGGAIQLNYNRYLKRFNIMNIEKICSCCGKTLYKQVIYLNLFQTKRTIEECPTCGNMFEGFGIITHGQIECNTTFMAENNRIKIVVDIDEASSVDTKVYAYMICLEPFIKKSSTKCDAVQGTGKRMKGENRITITIENFKIEEETNCGAHYLNAIVIIGHSISFIRRIIYIDSKGSGL